MIKKKINGRNLMKEKNRMKEPLMFSTRPDRELHLSESREVRSAESESRAV